LYQMNKWDLIESPVEEEHICARCSCFPPDNQTPLSSAGQNEVCATLVLPVMRFHGGRILKFRLVLSHLLALATACPSTDLRPAHPKELELPPSRYIAMAFTEEGEMEDRRWSNRVYNNIILKQN